MTFNEEELATIKHAGLEDLTIMERDTPFNGPSVAGVPHLHNLTVGRLLIKQKNKKPDVYAFATPAEAKNYTAEVKSLLASLKNHIEDNKDAGEQSQSFEL